MATRGAGKTTTDHNEIRRWVEQRGGCPARVKSTGKGDDPGILRIDYPGFSGRKTLEEVSWDEFFEWMDANDLAFVYQDKPDSRFSKLVARRTAEARTRGESGASKRSANGAGGGRTSTRNGARKKTATRSAAARGTRTAKKRTVKKTRSATAAKTTKRASGRAGMTRKKGATKGRARKSKTRTARSK